MSSERIELIGALARKHAAALTLYARQWSNQPDDIVQDSLIDLMTTDPWPQSPLAWLYGAVRFRALNRHRATRRRNRHETQLAAETQSWFEEDPTTRLQAQEATALLQGLSLELREVVILRLWSGLSFSEIGSLLQIDTSTASRRFSAAIEQLKAKCEPKATPASLRAGRPP